MINLPKAVIVIPRDSPALRREVETALREKWKHVDFTFIDGEADSRCRVTETVGFDGAALAESVRVEVMHIERKYR